jgi:nitrogenase-associated protein
MARITFYEKPGCGGNARQKELLRAAGHTLTVRSLLAEAWTRERLLAFFGSLPVAQWFNLSAPKVKTGKINPETIRAETALALMLEDPLLIRRPLMESEGKRKVGFVPEEIDAWVGLAGHTATEAELGCQGNDRCSGHDNGNASSTADA